MVRYARGLASRTLRNWHNQGKYFGIGREAKRVHPVAALATVVLLVTLVAVELAFAGSQGV
jgi:hypothetical protein